MPDYTKKSYGRNDEVNHLFKLFHAGKDISQHGPRRLGKTFVLDRMVEQAANHGFICIKIEIAGCTEPKVLFRRLCEEIDRHRGIARYIVNAIAQRMTQVLSPKSEQSGPWYQAFIGMDWETYLNRLLNILNSDRHHKWAILIDELPIFLKSMHDKGESGVIEARNFMNSFSVLRSKNSNVRWLITGSIGIDSLAQAGQYNGVLAKFKSVRLDPLSEEQAIDFLLDSGLQGIFPSRTTITKEEAKAVIEAVGWRSAYYLETFAHNLPENPETTPEKVQQNIQSAMDQMLQMHNRSTLNTWEEHIRKHHSREEAKFSFEILKHIAQIEEGLTIEALIRLLKTSVEEDVLYQQLLKLIDEGFLYNENLENQQSPYRFRIPILRLWWLRYRPSA